MANQLANSAKQMFLKGQLEAGDAYKIILMNTSFVFDRAAHHAYADISASELPTAGGYTAGGAALAGITFATDDTLNLASITWNDISWTATASLLISGAIIFDDDTAAPGGGTDDYTDAIVAWIDGGGTVMAPDGTPLLVQNIKVEFR